ncbi:MAG: TAT-variant-translocated molybdopterin oxidoreductase [Flavobacteriales bacterium]|nr:TAT-variant-translocated molybdopterin oxidoreductase [Flavobacteriales bacterium]
MSSTKRYWKDLGELHRDPASTEGQEHEFPQQLAIDQVLGDASFQGAATGRRDFLKFLGFSLGAATLAACETPVVKSIPYVNKPEDITPGVANWYASTYYDGRDFASILVKTREGRPIHIKGNPRFGINRDPALDKGTINSRINSSVLTLYDGARLKGPMKLGADGLEEADQGQADDAIMKGLGATAAAGKRIVLLTDTVISPSIRSAVTDLKAKYATVEHVQYDTVSHAGVVNAHAAAFGKRIFPSYDLGRADVVVAVGADFLSSWGSVTENVWQYARRRSPEAEGGMGRHYQIEARMSLSGANADVRVPLKPSELALAVISLHDHIAKRAGGAPVGGSNADVDAATADAANALLGARGRSVVLCDSNDTGVQTLVCAINHMLGNYGSTIDLTNHSWFFQGDDAGVAQLVKDMNAGSVGALLIAGVNPAYSLPDAEAFKAGLAKVGLTVSFSGYADETASLCQWVCPDHHYLESWNDFMPKVGQYALAQPAIRPLFATRQWPESLLRWTGSYASWHSYVRGVWRDNLASRGGVAEAFDDTWNRAVHDGVYAVAPQPVSAESFAADLAGAATAARKAASVQGEFELVLYTSEAIGDGRHANNPWLQELPDPLTKITWDNYVCMAPADAEAMGLNIYLGEKAPASLVKVTVGDRTIELPAVATPGQKRGSVAIALGYGRGANGEAVGLAAVVDGQPVGRNAYPMAAMADGTMRYVTGCSIAATGGTWPIGITQTHLTHMDRHSIVRETSLGVYQAGDKKAFNPPHELWVNEDVNGDGKIDARDKKPVSEFTLWEEHPVEGVGHRWGLSIDLNSCIGCGVCITACNSENNIPVVGKDEIRRSREMHWLRIDRYFSSDMTKERAKEDGLSKIPMYLAMERPAENPSVVFMPVMCQHCNHAPCETVCPVAATTHSNEGLNQMTYNRCIGTRYCSNNCPYKVRRFNWFNYVSKDFSEVNPAWDDLGRMVLNPDVTVRGRGVIEKCSMCVQSIQAGKLKAKKEGRPVKDGDIETACSAACGTGAIVFGDLNDKKSKVRGLATSDRSYHMLEEIGVRPNVNYLVKVRNVNEEATA